MAGPGLEPETPVILVRTSTTEIPWPIPMVHVAPTTTVLYEKYHTLPSTRNNVLSVPPACKT